jgi:hypothetical protein
MATWVAGNIKVYEFMATALPYGAGGVTSLWREIIHLWHRKQSPKTGMA